MLSTHAELQAERFDLLGDVEVSRVDLLVIGEIVAAIQVQAFFVSLHVVEFKNVVGLNK